MILPSRADAMVPPCKGLHSLTSIRGRHRLFIPTIIGLDIRIGRSAETIDLGRRGCSAASIPEMVRYSGC